MKHTNKNLTTQPSAVALPVFDWFWWRGKDSNLRRQSRQIYSLIPLTAREPLRTKPRIIDKNRRPVKPRPGSEVFHAVSTLKRQWVACRFRGIRMGPRYIGSRQGFFKGSRR